MKDVLLVDDDAEMVQSLARALSPLLTPRLCCAAGNGAMALSLIAKENPSVAVIDLCLDEVLGVESGFALLKEIRQRDESIRIIVLTGHGSLQNGIRALNLGAATFIEKPVEPAHLAALIADGVSQAQLRRDYQKLRSTESSLRTSLLLGTSPEMARLRDQLDFAASTNQAVLLLGETGTGKGLCARTIHDNSVRAKCRLVHYHPNFGGGDLIQSELFGHLKGSFTGATESRKGLVSEAQGGTLFLDELDEIPAETQVKLLDLIQEKRIRPLGADDFKNVDCRIIAASNRPLAEILEQGKIRRDLYHRIAQNVIELPPLRIRLSDIPDLASGILKALHATNDLNVFSVSEQATDALCRYDWPGNARELQGVIEGAAYKARFRGRSAIELGDLTIGPTAIPLVVEKGTFNEQIETFKFQIVQDSMRRNDGNQVQAARELGLDRGTLRRILNRN